MKSPLGKFGFKLHKTDAKDKRDLLPSAQLDELAQAAQDMQDMRNCYDSLLSAAAATANSAYEFSESLRKWVLVYWRKLRYMMMKKVHVLSNLAWKFIMFTVHLIIKMPHLSGRVLLMLGKVQFELQKLVDSYRSHIFLTITNPSESLLNELRTVELNFFRKGLKSLEAVDQLVKIVTDQQHIDYQFCGSEDDGREDDENGDDTNDGRELSFDYRTNKQGLDVFSASRNSMEVEYVDMPFPQASVTESTELNPDKNQGGFNISVREPRPSHSAPIFPERKPDPVERIKQIQSSVGKSNTYVLPTPIDAKGVVSSRTSGSVAHTRPTDLSGRTHNLWHSSPLEQKKHEKDPGDSHLSEFTVFKARSHTKRATVTMPPTSYPLL
ncbi:hypothetical protein GH714_032179 [Hevea brasiliensis]|uniref:Uncharacterized protein n=1 Tax=Hevea brasiliensis TaxID=3981 RepID=A0A6A6NDJ4_HEVBR|nr:hypothetical protein GH714_032179 [Hevea brasiliensis]